MPTARDDTRRRSDLLNTTKSLKGVLKRLRRFSGGIPGRGILDELANLPDPTVSHIGRLPDELLIVILEFVHSGIFANRRQVFFVHWTRLLRVCKHWRAVVLSVSSLWRVIPVYSPASLLPLQICLSLHGNVPLEVLIQQQWLALAALDHLQPHISSVRVLDLQVLHMHPNAPPFPDLLSIRLPHLEVLRIWPAIVYDRPEVFGPPQISLHSYPQLQRLELCNLISPSNITNLRAIKFSQCSWPFSFHDLIQTLNRCSQLEELQLDHSLFSLADSIPRLITPRTPCANLPSLRKLDIEDDSSGLITGFMACIQTPAMASLRILALRRQRSRPAVQDANDQVETHDFGRLFRPLLPIAEAVLPRYPSNAGPVKTHLSFMQDVCMLKTSSTKLSTPISTDLFVRFKLAWTRVVPDALHDIALLFRETPVTALVVEANPYHVLPAVWEEVFTSLPLLETLELTGNGTWTAMWQGLRSASAGGVLCCPQLRAVHIRHTSRPEDNYPAPPDDRDLTIMADALQERVEGGAKLEELRWAVYSVHHANYYAARGRFLTRLAPFVERITYEDLGECFPNANIDIQITAVP